MAKLTAKQRKLINDAAELVAFQVPTAPFTVRRGLDAMAAEPALMAETKPVFGMDFADLVQGLTDWNMLDVEFQPESIF